MDIQARVPAALCALHNFMRRHEPDALCGDLDDADIEEEWNILADMEEEVDEVLYGHLGDGPTTAAERRRAEALRDRIAQEMWVDYQHTLQERGIL